MFFYIFLNTFSQQYFVDAKYIYKIKVPSTWSTMVMNKNNDDGFFRVMVFEDIKKFNEKNFDIFITNNYKLDIVPYKDKYIERYRKDLGKYNVKVTGNLLELEGRKVLQILTDQKGLSSYLVPFNKTLYIFNFLIPDKDEDFKIDIVKSLSVIN